MWTCGECQARFTQRNQSHSCVQTTLEAFLAARPPGGVALCRELIREVEAIGPVTLHPVKSRIALLVEVRFAAINRISVDSIRGHVWLREERKSERFLKIEKLGARDWLYHFEISAERPLDDELRAFLRLGYQNGQREAARGATPRDRGPRPTTRRLRRPPAP